VVGSALSLTDDNGFDLDPLGETVYWYPTWCRHVLGSRANLPSHYKSLKYGGGRSAGNTSSAMRLVTIAGLAADQDEATRASDTAAGLSTRRLREVVDANAKVSSLYSDSASTWLVEHTLGRDQNPEAALSSWFSSGTRHECPSQPNTTASTLANRGMDGVN